jgi:hypothetical protein
LIIRWPTGRAEELLRWGVAFALSVALASLVGLGIVAFVSAQETTKQALSTRDQTAAAASKRITSLQADLTLARADLTAAKAKSAENGAKLDAVLAQLAQIGVDPVVVATPGPVYMSPTTTTTVRRARPAPPATTSTTRPPAATTTTTPTTTTTTTAAAPPAEPSLPCRILTVFCTAAARSKGRR